MNDTLEYACPRCDVSPLETRPSGLYCAGCQIEFPNVGPVPALFAEPNATLAEWRGRFRYQEQTHSAEVAGLRATAAEPGLSDRTRTRLETMAQAAETHIAQLRSLLEPLALAEATASAETHLALRTRLPGDQGVLTYQHNIHRDWCWGDEENALSWKIVADLLDGREPGRTLVLGAGAGRLAYDIHEELAPDLTVALDFNPLLVLLGARMATGDAVSLYEFPLAARDLESRAVLRELKAPSPARAGLHFCLADVHRPPFPPRAFDTIVTPWLVDIVPERFDILAKRINRLVSDQGRWINFGSLSFHQADPALQLSPEECIDVIEAAGFQMPATQDVEIPYLCSPASRHARRELVFSFRADKRHHIKKVERYTALPDWVVKGRDPVPQLEPFRMQAVSTRIHAFIMSLIDGRRSIADMAAIMEQERLMTRVEAEPAIRSFLIKMYEDSQRRQRF